MKLTQLLTYLTNCSRKDLYIVGRYGYVRAKPQNDPGHGDAYTVDSSYRDEGKTVRMSQQRNYRLATICCLCVGVLFGEHALDPKTIQTINTHFSSASTTTSLR